MKYIKNEDDDEQDEVSMTNDPFNRSNNRNFIDLATPPAVKQIVLDEKKKRRKRTISNKPRQKRTIDDKERALLRYKLRFSTNSTQNEIKKLNTKFKDPTDKLFNKIYTNKNSNELGDKFDRRIINKLNILQNEKISSLVVQKLDRGNNDNGARTRRETENENRSESRRVLLETLQQRQSTTEAETSVGAEHRTADQDFPPRNYRRRARLSRRSYNALRRRTPRNLEAPVPAPPQPSSDTEEEEMSSDTEEEEEEARPAYVELLDEPQQAQDYDKTMEELIDDFKINYKLLNDDKDPHGNMLRGLKKPEDVHKLNEKIQRQYDLKQDMLDLLKVAQEVETANEQRENLKMLQEDETSNELRENLKMSQEDVVLGVEEQKDDDDDDDDDDTDNEFDIDEALEILSFNVQRDADQPLLFNDDEEPDEIQPLPRPSLLVYNLV